LKPEEIEPKVEAYKKVLLEKWESLPDIFVSSADKFMGREEILGFIDKVNKENR
jgi:GTP-binding protein